MQVSLVEIASGFVFDNSSIVSAMAEVGFDVYSPLLLVT